MGYSASVSDSSSATSGNKTSTGPVTFGGVSFGAQGSSGVSWWIVGAIAAAVAFFVWKGAK